MSKPKKCFYCMNYNLDTEHCDFKNKAISIEKSLQRNCKLWEIADWREVEIQSFDGGTVIYYIP